MVNAGERNEDGADERPDEELLPEVETVAESDAAAAPKPKRTPRAKAVSEGPEGEAKPKRVRAVKAKPEDAGISNGEVTKPARRRRTAAEAEAGVEAAAAARRKRVVKPVEQQGEQLSLLAEVAGTPIEAVPVETLAAFEPEAVIRAGADEPETVAETTPVAEAEHEVAKDPMAEQPEAQAVFEQAEVDQPVAEVPVEEQVVTTAGVWEETGDTGEPTVVLGREFEADEQGAGERLEATDGGGDADAVQGGWVVTPVTRAGAAGWGTTAAESTSGWSAEDVREPVETTWQPGAYATGEQGEREAAEEYRDEGNLPWEAVPEGGEKHEEHPHRLRLKTVVRELVETGLLALLVFLSVKASFQNFKVDGLSMSPTLHNGQFLIVNKLVYSEVDMAKVGDFVPFVSGGEDPTRYVFHGPQRGDIIVLMDPRNPSQDLIKRVIGLPGETFEIVDGKVYINGYRLEEPYITTEWRDSKARMTIPAGEYFVMGDNRNNSLDSRFDSVGLIPKELIIGKALLSYWPREQFGLAPNSPGTSGGPTLTDERVNQNGRTQGSGSGR